MNFHHFTSRQGPAHHRRAHSTRPRSGHPVLAAESGAGYDPGDGPDEDGPHGHNAAGYDPEVDGPAEPSVRESIATARRALTDVLAAVANPNETSGGEVAGLLELLEAVDTAQAAAVELTGTIQRRGLCERSTALPLDGLLAFRSRAPYGQRRGLANAAEQLPAMPHLRRAFHAGLIGWAEVLAVLGEARSLNATQRTELDAGFADPTRLERLEPDVLVDVVRETAARMRPDLDRERNRRVIEHRYLALQPALDGSGAGYFELDAAAYGPVAQAIEAAMPPLSAGPADITRHAPGQRNHHGNDGGECETAEGDPAFCDPLDRRDRGRARGDALMRLAEVFLAGPLAARTDAGPVLGDDGATAPVTSAAANPAAVPLGRARPLMQVVCDLALLTGHDSNAARAGRALIANIGGPVRLTPETVRRLACDADLQLIFTDRGRVLGTTDPTDDIPTPVRRALQARDQGCRFPGCSVPIHWTDAHHVRFRHHGGPTTLDNLVLLCRRHHTAVHDGGWKLTLTPNATVTVTRGRHHHTTDPPHQRGLPPP